ncbi:HNH endonuclease [Streptomyces sp. ERV7]|uniref:HNH endonuclease signature motif containing protein n=1 Tax=Streptomyces sp. ERV7 TaxID=1322334 RepID=UPI0007F33F54|nr:HNH endonuclease [Streptomyces sp. ERV7]OAR25985.1 HNH endonuclease [Streptomyces sp. ERV7]
MNTPKYTRDLLARTAADSASLVDMLRRLDAPIGAGPLRYLRHRLEHYGIEVSHFVDEPLPTRKRRSYSRELLEEAAAHSQSIREMCEYLGYPPSDSPYSLIRQRLDRFGIDTTHFTSGRRYSAGVIPREPLVPLVPLVAESTSMAGVLKALGLDDNGAARARLRHSLDAHGISTDHFTGQGHFRGEVSPYRKSAAETLVRREAGSSRTKTALLRRALSAAETLVRREAGSSRTKTALLRRALDELGVPRVCAACGIGDTWQGQRLVLEIDHLSGDRLDNRRENLRYLCPSCHSQTSTFSNRSPRTGAPRSPVE